MTKEFTYPEICFICSVLKDSYIEARNTNEAERAKKTMDTRLLSEFEDIARFELEILNKLNTLIYKTAPRSRNEKVTYILFNNTHAKEQCE